MLSILTNILPLVSDVLDKVVPDPKAREAAKLKLIQEAQAGKLKEVENQLSAIVAEAQSKDPWTSDFKIKPNSLIFSLLLSLSCCSKFSFVSGSVCLILDACNL